MKTSADIADSRVTTSACGIIPTTGRSTEHLSNINPGLRRGDILTFAEYKDHPVDGNIMAYRLEKYSDIVFDRETPQNFTVIETGYKERSVKCYPRNEAKTENLQCNLVFHASKRESYVDSCHITKNYTVDATTQLSFPKQLSPNYSKYQDISHSPTTNSSRKTLESTSSFPSHTYIRNGTQTQRNKATIFFKTLFGPNFSISSNFHLITPPVIPDFLVRNETLADGVSPNVLGRGSFGRVVKARFTNSWHHFIVVKEIFDNNENVEVILEEAKMLLFLERTGYVPGCFGVVSEGALGDVFGVLQECVGDGLNLETYLWKGRGKVDDICLLDIAKQVTEGLREIHDMGVIINDIKANNILMDSNIGIPKVKYCDMGLATYKVGRTYSFSNDADLFCYLAPEVRNGGTSSFKSDVYSIGRVLDMIQDFGEMVCLYPATDKCSVEDPEQRIDTEELALIVSFIYEQHLTEFTMKKTALNPRRTKDKHTVCDENGNIIANDTEDKTRASLMSIISDVKPRTSSTLDIANAMNSESDSDLHAPATLSSASDTTYDADCEADDIDENNGNEITDDLSSLSKRCSVFPKTTSIATFNKIDNSEMHCRSSDFRSHGPNSCRPKITNSLSEVCKNELTSRNTETTHALQQRKNRTVSEKMSDRTATVDLHHESNLTIGDHVENLCTAVVVYNENDEIESTFRMLISTLLCITLFKIILILYF